MDGLNHLSLWQLFTVGTACFAACFAIGAGLGWLLNRRRP